MPKKTSSRKTCSAAVAGDFCPKTPESQNLIRSGGVDSILESVRPVLDAADLRIIQFETALTEDNTPIVKDGPNLRAHPDSVEFVKNGGFDAALLANNHTGDYGEKALLQTQDILQKNGIATVGAGKNAAEANRPLYLKKNGFTLAVLNQCEHEFGWAWGTHAGTAPLDFAVLRENILAAKKKADSILVVLHGGMEHYPFPSPGMIDRLHRIADMGADAVMNIHPHTPQGIETYHGVPIVYSPGNFYFPYGGTMSIQWYAGYLPTFTFRRGGKAKVQYTAFRFSNEKVSLLPKAEQAEFRKYMDVLSAPLADPAEMQALLEAWALLSGPVRFDILRRGELPANPDPASWTDPVLAKIVSARNMISCEAHNEVLRTWIRRFEQHLPEDKVRKSESFHRIRKGPAAETAGPDFLRDPMR